MKTTGINGSPKHLMVWLDGYYWTNFILITLAYVLVSCRVFLITFLPSLGLTPLPTIPCRYVFISYRVFIITAALRDVVIPKEGGAALAKRSVAVGVLIAAIYGIAYLAYQPVIGTPPPGTVVAPTAA